MGHSERYARPLRGGRGLPPPHHRSAAEAGMWRGRTRLSLLWLLCLLPGVGFAALQSSEPKVSFSCVGPGGLHIDGTGTTLQLQDKGDVLVLSVPLDSVTTGIGLRDTHMHEKYLETGQ